MGWIGRLHRYPYPSVSRLAIYTDRHLLNYKNGDLNIAGSLLYTTAETTYANGGITQTGSIEVIESIICRIDKYFKYAPHINIKRNSSICIVKSNCFMECSPIAIYLLFDSDGIHIYI